MREEIKNMSRDEKIALLTKAKDAYYNSGEEILSDAEYDELEAEVGLENNNYIGSKAGNYNVKHAFIMGSLSKIQIKEQKDGEVNWEEAAQTITNFLNKANGITYYETTPKLDGCSFSAEFRNVNGRAYLETVATRGNGEYGTSIKHWFKPILKTEYWNKIDDAVTKLCKEGSNDILCIRGEVLVEQSEFSKKYSDLYTNPRAFAAGMLGIKYSDATEEKLRQGKDLHFVCYDYRLVYDKPEGKEKFIELSWMNKSDSTYKMLAPFLGHIGELPNEKYCIAHPYKGKISVEELQEIYEMYDDYRCNTSEYALDGIVFKPNCSARKYNENRERPVDCIAMKFMPMINSTTIEDILWQVKKTGEYFPTAIVAPIIMPDGKKITKASLHNYNYVVTNGVGIGAEVRISLAGDIIPYVYEIVKTVNTKNNANMNLPEDGYVYTEPNSGAMHYMKKFTEDEAEKNAFLSSCLVLNINTIGPASAELLYDTMCDEFDELTNIVYLMNEESYRMIYDKLGDSKSVQNMVENMNKFAANITMTDIIKSFCFKSCGDKASEVCARIMSGLSYDTTSLPEVAYSWAFDKSSRNYYLVKSVMDDLDVEFLDKDDEADEANKIPVIMTGSPEEITEYKTKEQWLAAHAKLRNTSSWKEVKILFTDSLESNTGKMQKARKQGIEIRTYDDADEFLTGKKPLKEAQKFEYNMNNVLF